MWLYYTTMEILPVQSLLWFTGFLMLSDYRLLFSWADTVRAGPQKGCFLVSSIFIPLTPVSEICAFIGNKEMQSNSWRQQGQHYQSTLFTKCQVLSTYSTVWTRPAYRHYQFTYKYSQGNLTCSHHRWHASGGQLQQRRKNLSLTYESSQICFSNPTMSTLCTFGLMTEGSL